MSDRILGAVCIAASAAMAWTAKDYAAAISYEPVGPRAFPLLLACGLGLSGLWLVLRPTVGTEAFRDVPFQGTSRKASVPTGGRSTSHRPARPTPQGSSSGHARGPPGSYERAAA